MKTLDEFVMVVDNVLTEDIAAALLNEYANSADWLATPIEQGGGISGEYPAKVALITHPHITNKSPRRKQLAQTIVESIRSAFDQYHEIFSRRTQGYNFLHIDSLIGLRLIRYETGQYMGVHTDKYPDSDSNQVSWPAVTFSINVNDDFEGGELVLLDGEIAFKGMARQGIIFPANFMYPHSVEKVTKGTRYSLAGWFR